MLARYKRSSNRRALFAVSTSRAIARDARAPASSFFCAVDFCGARPRCCEMAGIEESARTSAREIIERKRKAARGCNLIAIPGSAGGSPALSADKREQYRYINERVNETFSLLRNLAGEPPALPSFILLFCTEQTCPVHCRQTDAEVFVSELRCHPHTQRSVHTACL